MKKLATTLIGLSLLSSSYAQNATEVLNELQNCMNQQKDVAPIVKKIRSMPNSERKQLIFRIERAWPKVKQQYLFELKQAIQSAKNNTSPDQSNARIGELRAQFLCAYRLPEAEMPSALKSQSAPAIRELQARMLPSSQAIIQAGGSQLKTSQYRAVTLATFRDELLRSEASRIAADSRQSLQLAEQQVAVTAADVNHKTSQVIEQNRRIAAQNRLPQDIVKGIEECNKWRVLAGLHACVIDPKLCLTASDHAKDMAQGGFFSHESPISGKKTPWDRAMRFSTTASGENIFMGSPSHFVANQRWFHSPGHHKVMFDPSFRRIGLGRHGKHWVQMFGR